MAQSNEGGCDNGHLISITEKAAANKRKQTNDTSGERGIRTLGTVARTTVFETAPFNRSGISPNEAKLSADAFE